MSEVCRSRALTGAQPWAPRLPIPLASMAVAAALALGAAGTQAQTVSYTGQGFVGAIAPPSPAGTVPFLAEGTYELVGLGTWDLSSTFVFNIGAGTGAGEFGFSQGGNSFSGTIATAQTFVASLPGFEISYTITGGTGVYAGATGNGAGLIVLTPLTTGTSGPYIEAGIMDISVVPEPASALLMLGGVAALLGRRLLTSR